MKLLFFHRWSGVRYGGTETHIRELALRFAKRGHDVSILTREGKAVKSLIKLDSTIKVRTISKSWGESDFSYPLSDIRLYLYTILFVVKSLVKLLKYKFEGERFDFLSVHFYTEARLLRLVKQVLKWPYVFLLEGYTDREANEAQFADVQLSISQTIIEKCFKNYSKQNCSFMQSNKTFRFSNFKRTSNWTLLLQKT